MARKTYVLLDALNVDTPAYQQLPGNQRVQITKIPWHRPYLRLPVHGEDGVVRMLRYKATSKYLFEDEQMEKEKIDANAKFTDQERDDLYFRHGVLVTEKLQAQKFLEANPEFIGSEYKSENVRNKCYKLLDEKAEALIKNKDHARRIKAASKIMGLELKDAQEMIIRLNGSFVKTPDEVEECQNWLIQFLDDSDDAGIDEIMKGEKEITVDEKTTVLIGKLLKAKLLSFDEVPGQVSKKDKTGKWISVREMSTEYSMEQRKSLFSDFLNMEEGKVLKSDLEKDLAANKGSS